MEYVDEFYMFYEAGNTNWTYKYLSNMDKDLQAYANFRKYILRVDIHNNIYLFYLKI